MLNTLAQSFKEKGELKDLVNCKCETTAIMSDVTQSYIHTVQIVSNFLFWISTLEDSSFSGNSLCWMKGLLVLGRQ